MLLRLPTITAIPIKNESSTATGLLRIQNNTVQINRRGMLKTKLTFPNTGVSIGQSIQSK